MIINFGEQIRSHAEPSKIGFSYLIIRSNCVRIIHEVGRIHERSLANAIQELNTHLHTLENSYIFIICYCLCLHLMHCIFIILFWYPLNVFVKIQWKCTKPYIFEFLKSSLKYIRWYISNKKVYPIPVQPIF